MSLTTKRQERLRAQFQKYAETLGVNINGLGDSLRRSGVTNLHLIFLADEIALEAAQLENLEIIAAEFPSFEDSAHDIKSLCVRAGACGITQAELSKMVDVSPVSLSRWCTGVHAPSTKNLEKIKGIVEALELARSTAK